MNVSKGDLNIDFLGERKLPLLTVDNFTGGLEEIRRQAIGSVDYQPDRVTKYPGIRAILPREYIIACVKPLLPYIRKIFKIPEQLQPHPKGYYSLITQEEGGLSPWQTIPHFDTTSPHMIAFIHYLNEGDYGGTGFFKHRGTNYDYIDEPRKDPFLMLTRDFLSSGRGTNTYCGADHPEFELYHSVAYKTNRMVLFPGYMLHTALVNRKTDISADPLAGRLTANLFVQFL